MSAKHDIAVIGAGAKAAAIAAKCHVLNTLGLGPISVLIVEALEPAASWNGRNGFTSGAEPLSTSPAKDVGFPYCARDLYGKIGGEIDREMLSFSWQQHLVEHKRYSQWIDAGSPMVTHGAYGEYLAWVLSRARRGVRLVSGRAMQLSIGADCSGWTVDVASGRGVAQYRADASVLTGPGVQREIPHDALAAKRMFYSDERRVQLEAIPKHTACEVAIVGAGESAMACVAMLRSKRPEAQLTVYTPALPMSRAESFLENRVYSSPEEVDWGSLALDVRRDFINRTDRGVFAQHAVGQVAADRRCRFATGRVMRVAFARDAQRPLRVHYRSGEVSNVAGHDYIVNCTGFDVLAQARSLISPTSETELDRQDQAFWRWGPQPVRIGWSLELEGISPPLHVPALATLSQGPGFANLSSLGTLADRVIAPALTRKGRNGGWTQRMSNLPSETTRKELIEQCF